MKKIFFVICLLMGLHNSLFAQPYRVWSTYYGKYKPSLGTHVSSVVYDPLSHTLYVAGTTSDTSGIATPGSFQPVFQPVTANNPSYDRQIFLARFDTSGNRIWCTYIGSNAATDEYPKICADHLGNIILAGRTSSVSNIATPGAFISSGNGRYIPFMMKFNSNGQRLWGTYLFKSELGNGSLYNGPYIGLAVDIFNNIYTATATMDTAGIGTPEAFQPVISDTNFFSGIDGCLMKFDPDGGKVWGSYYGGENIEDITALCVGDDNYIYGAGYTNSLTLIATPGAEVPVNPEPVNGGGFMFKFTLEGQRVWGTYISGNQGLTVSGIMVKNNELFLSGTTVSNSGIATAGSHQSIFGGGNGDAVLMKFTTAGHKVWGTYYGGPGDDGSGFYAAGLAFDEEDNLYLAGNTNSADKIRKGCTYNATYKNSFIAKWNRDGALLWGSYNDGTIDGLSSVPGNNTFFVTGHTAYDGLATPGAHQTTKVAGTVAGTITMFRGNFVCPELSADITVQGRVLSIDNGYQNYQWYYNGIPVNGATAAQYSASDTGSYYVVFTQCDCTYTSDTLHFTGPLGITEFQGNNASFLAYPNPGKGIYTLQYNGTLSRQEWQYSVTDISGRIVTEGVLNFQSGAKPEINLNRFENGVYFVRLSGKNGNAMLRLVKSR